MQEKIRLLEARIAEFESLQNSSIEGFPIAELHHKIFAANSLITLVFDSAGGRIVSANSAACSFYGYERNALCSMRIWDLAMSGEAETRAAIQQVINGQRTDFVVEHRLAGGEVGRSCFLQRSAKQR
jgi:PAS domain S-box-containing protein